MKSTATIKTAHFFNWFPPSELSAFSQARGWRVLPYTGQVHPLEKLTIVACPKKLTLCYLPYIA
jgi:hypothetical protein